MNPSPRLNPGTRRLLKATACALTLSAWPAFAQEAAAPAPESPGVAKAPAVLPASASDSTAPAAKEDVVVLSPFEVVEDTRGYYAANSMSGTRFNTKLEDLGASISVVTKELMSDFAMLDINDVFMYTASTEGTATYTDYVMDRNGQLTDNVQLNPASANRVRGMSSANPTLDNFELSGRVPMDKLSVDAVEISRGPNSTISGLGNPGGTVNQVAASANLQKSHTQLMLRVDDLGGYRGSIDHNQVLLPNKFALRVSNVYQEDAFVRKPSGVTTRRLNAMAKFQPFKGTTLTGSVSSYKMHGTRPNYTPPRDYVSYWLESGSPGWNPATGFITIDGVQYGMTSLTDGTPKAGSTISWSTSTATLGRLPSYFSMVGGAFQRSNLYVDQTGVNYWQAPTSNTGVSPNANAGLIRLVGPTSSNLRATVAGRYTDQPLWTTTKSVSSQDMYDWSKVNLSSVNKLRDEVETYMFRIDQIILDTPHHFLAAQGAVLREDATRYQRTPLGNSSTSGQTGQLWVDVNTHNLDGTVNPNFGRLFMGAIEPITRELPLRWDTARAQLAYRLDFSKDDGWTKWLGTHTFSPYYERKERISRSYGYREALTSDHSWTAVGQSGFEANKSVGRAVQANVTGGPQAGPNVLREFIRYYVGDPGTGSVQYAPSDFAYGDYTFLWGTTGNWRKETAHLDLLATSDVTGGNNNLNQKIKTPGAVLQSFLWDGRFVTTFGARRDKVYSKNGLTPVLLTNNNTEHDRERIDAWQDTWRVAEGDTKSFSAVLRPFRDLAGLRRMAESDNPASRFFSDLFRGMAFSYNKSDNFLVQAPAFDLYLNDLPNTTAKGTDYGIWLNLLDGKLVIRGTKWENTQFDIRNGDANTVAQRVMRMDFDVSSDTYQLYDRANAWARIFNPTWSDTQVSDYIANVMKIPTPLYNSMLDAFRGGQIAATNDVYAKGMELEINYNPTKMWSLAASATKTESMNQNVSSTVQQWIDERMPVWTSIVDPNTDPNLTYGTGSDATTNRGWVADASNPNHLWWLHRYGSGSQSASENFQTFVVAPYSVIKQQEGKSLPSVRKYNFRLNTSYSLAGVTDHPILKKFKVGGAIRWEDKGAIGFLGKTPTDGTTIIRELDASKPVWDSSHVYLDLMLSYRTKLWRDKIDATFQINARNLGEHGELRAIGVFPDGEPNAYRIFDPQQFIFQVTFDL